MKQVYLDNAATSWPKPLSVIDSMNRYLREYGGSPGRSAHRFSIQAARELFLTRELLARFFNAPSSERIVFTHNATHALNIAIQGMLKSGDHVVTSSMEHNSVIRPLRKLEQEGFIHLSVLNCSDEGLIDVEGFRKSLSPLTRMVVLQHGSNVTGTIFPIRAIGQICHDQGIPLLVDAAQTAGCVPIDMIADHIDLLAITGHKHLLGPPGTGALILNNGVDPSSLMTGGSGSASEQEFHPEFYPDRLEAGTPNTAGILGLKAGLQYILEHDMATMMQHQRILYERLYYGLRECEGIIIHAANSAKESLPLFSVTMPHILPGELAFQLDQEYGIMTRPGLHCAPLAHRTLGTFPEGSLRFSIGVFNTPEEIEYTVQSMKQIIQRKK